MPVAASWFQRTGDGMMTLPDGASAAHLARAAAAITDPAEIRWLWLTGANGRAMLVRRYIGARGDDGHSAVVDVARFWRMAVVGDAQLAAMRRGTVVWPASAAYDPSQPRDAKGRWSAAGGRLSGLANDAMANRGRQDLHDIGLVEANAPESIIGYRRYLSDETMRKVLAKHGVGGTGNDTTPLTANDFALIPAITKSGVFTEQNYKSGQRTLTYHREINGKKYRYVEVVGAKRRRVIAKTLFVPEK